MHTVARTEPVTASDGVGLEAGVVGDLAVGGRPVVLLHGLSQQRGFWDPVIRRLRHRPVIAVDQRGHGASDARADADFSIPRVAHDVIDVLDALAVERAHVTGHSWGAAVAIAVAAEYPDRIASVGLIDGGLWARDPHADRAAELERLRPPTLGIPADDLWTRIASGPLGSAWSAEVREALEPTFVMDGDGRLRTRIGIDRHMAVLSAMLEYDPWGDAARIACPAWHVRCLGPGTSASTSADPWLDLARQRTAATGILMQEWEGAIHDVPLQWPALVAGFIDALCESADREETG